MNFKLLANSGKARVGQLITKYSTIETPVFMPVGTLGTVKGITKQDLYRLNFNIILSNTYHLMLRPGLDVIKKIGGLNKFMSWNKSILTDSGLISSGISRRSSRCSLVIKFKHFSQQQLSLSQIG